MFLCIQLYARTMCCQEKNTTPGRFLCIQVYNNYSNEKQVSNMTILYILAAMAALTLLLSLYTYCVGFYSPKSKRVSMDEPLNGEQYHAVAEHIFRMTHIMEKIPFEKVYIEAEDGTRLFGRYYHVRDGAPLEILFHGYRSHPYRDCSGGHALSRKMGFNAIVVDQRAHGESGSNTICFGIKERYDVRSWVNYANRRFGSGTPIILSGLSMGAATVLMASNLDLPSNVACILADSPYSAPIAIIEKVCADLHYPVRVCRPFIHLGAFIYGHFILNETTAKEAVSNTNIPILLIHGESDHFVPCPMSHQIAASCASRVEVHTFPEAGHGLCYMTDPIRYERTVFHFLSSIDSLRDSISEEFQKKLFSQGTD